MNSESSQPEFQFGKNLMVNCKYLIAQTQDNFLSIMIKLMSPDAVAEHAVLKVGGSITKQNLSIDHYFQLRFGRHWTKIYKTAFAMAVNDAGISEASSTLQSMLTDFNYNGMRIDMVLKAYVNRGEKVPGRV
jgi:hypothetical protein